MILTLYKLIYTFTLLVKLTDEIILTTLRSYSEVMWSSRIFTLNCSTRHENHIQNGNGSHCGNATCAKCKHVCLNVIDNHAISNLCFQRFQIFLILISIQYSNKEMTLLMSDQGKGTESANNDARKWPILPFDVSRDFIISKEILV